MAAWSNAPATCGASGACARPTPANAAKKSPLVRLRVNIRACTRGSLERLGPVFVKLGQTLSTRADLLPVAYCVELSRLQDNMTAFPHETALEILKEQWGQSPDTVFEHLPMIPTAAASIGQVYKARLIGGKLVAVKVQRPNVQEVLELDAHILRLLAEAWQRAYRPTHHLPSIFDQLIGRIFEEVDYRQECEYARRFRALYHAEGDPEATRKGSGQRRRGKGGRSTGHWEQEVRIHVPQVLPEYCTQKVLMTEWVEGCRLTDKEALRQGNVAISQLLAAGVKGSVEQLLHYGLMHLDPHPGNLLVDRSGNLVYVDFGMVSDVPVEDRFGMIRIVVNYVNSDAAALAQDFIHYKFMPPSTDVEQLTKALSAALANDNNAPTSQDFQTIVAQMSGALYAFGFRVPAQYARIIRALITLEGSATALDPDFQVISWAYPHVLTQVLRDRSPEMRQVLRSLLLENDGRVRWSRLERMLLPIAEQVGADSSARAGAWFPFGEACGMHRERTDKSEENVRLLSTAVEDGLEFLFGPRGKALRESLLNDVFRSVELHIKPLGSDDPRFAHLREGQCSPERDGDDDTTQVPNVSWDQMKMTASVLARMVLSAPNVWVPLLWGMAHDPEVTAFVQCLVSGLTQRLGRQATEELIMEVSYTLYQLDLVLSLYRIEVAKNNG